MSADCKSVINPCLLWGWGGIKRKKCNLLSLLVKGEMGKIKRKGCLAGVRRRPVCTGVSHQERAVFLRTD